MAVTLFTVFALTQVIEIFFAEATGGVVSVLVGAGVSCSSFTRTDGDENSKFLAFRYTHPSLSLKTVVATCGVPSALTTETLALTGALENP